MIYRIEIRSKRRNPQFVHIAALTWLLKAYLRKHLEVILTISSTVLCPLPLQPRLSIYGVDYLLAAGPSGSGRTRGLQLLNNLLKFVHFRKRKACESHPESLDRGSEESKLNLPIFEKLSNFIKLDITFSMI